MQPRLHGADCVAPGTTEGERCPSPSGYAGASSAKVIVPLIVSALPGAALSDTTNASEALHAGRSSGGGKNSHPLMTLNSSARSVTAVPEVVAGVVSLIRPVAVAAASPDRALLIVPAPPPDPAVTVAGNRFKATRRLPTVVAV